MKLILVLCLMSLTSAAFGCANFSGTYLFGPNTLIIEQQGCETLTLTYADKVESYLLDNQEREVARTHQYSTVASAAFVQYSPIIRMTVKNFYSTGMQEIYFRRLSLFSNGHKAVLLDELGRYRRDGYFMPYHQISYDKKM